MIPPYLYLTTLPTRQLLILQLVEVLQGDPALYAALGKAFVVVEDGQAARLVAQGGLELAHLAAGAHVVHMEELVGGGHHLGGRGRGRGSTGQ